MTRIPYDQTAKHLLDGALEGAGRAEAQHEVSSEPQWIDVWFERDTSKSASPGLIGRMAAQSCAFEIFHGPLTLVHALDCLAKQLGVYRRRRRRAREASDVSPMWLLTTQQPGSILQQMLAQALDGWPAGFYRMRVPALPLHIVSIGALPRIRDTLMLRLMGANEVLADALAELNALPSNAWERTAATDALAVLHSHAARTSIPSDPSEKAILMSASETYERIKNEGRAEGRAEGQAAGWAEGQRAFFNRMLQRRFGELPSSLVARIEAADVAQLERWAAALLDAKTLDDVFR